MNVLLVIDHFPSEPGGVKKIVVELARHLSERHSVVVVVPAASPRNIGQGTSADAPEGSRWTLLHQELVPRSRLLCLPAHYIRLPVARRYGYRRLGLPATLLYGRTVGRALARDLARRPDVVHTFTADMTGHVALEIARVHEAVAVCTGSPHPGAYGDGPIDSRLYKHADAIVAVSWPDREVYVRLGVPPPRIEVIHPPSADRGIGRREEARARLRIGGHLVLFAGARRWYKGADILRSAAPAIAAQVASTTIAFVGPGEPIRPARGAKMIDAGEVDDETMGDWIRAADVLVLPSLYEACSIVVLEAWSAGVPVVVSDIPTLSYQVRASNGGVAVPRDPQRVAEAVVDLLRDPGRRARLGAAGRAYWEDHCPIEKVIAAHEDLYARLVERRRFARRD